MKKTHFISICFITFFMSINIFAQKEKFEIPTLDKGKIFNAKLTPDSEQEEILSAYLKGKITKDTLKIKVKGTYMTQNVVITVLCLDKNEEINVEIAKGQWKKVERKGKTKNGFYQISFKTARDFGIAVHSNKTGTPFNVIIWTSGELKPKDNSLFIPISEYNKKNNTSFNDTNETLNVEKNNESNNNQKSNTMYYIIIVVLILIAILLFMLLKNKKNKMLGIFILFLTITNSTYSQVRQMTWANHLVVMENLNRISSGVSNAIKIAEFYKEGEDGKSNYNLLNDEDRDFEPNIDPDGQPELPSSCISVGNKNGPTRNKVKPRNNNRNTNRTTTTEGGDTKYDEDGNAIDYGDNNPTTNSSSSGSQVMDNYQTNTQGDGLKKDEDGSIIPDSGPVGQIMDDEAVVIHNIEHPKYDKDGKVIQYDTSDRPRHDADGVPINYPTENDKTDYNKVGRPKYDKNGKPIIYDDMENPKYDKNGSVIKYKNVSDEPLEGAPENMGNNEAGKGNMRESETAYDDKGGEETETNSNNNRNQTGGNKGESAGKTMQNDGNKQDNTEGCKCLEKAYSELESIRYKFEKLRIIYNSQEKITKYAISFGDDVSPLTGGIGGLAWQKERFKILEQMKTFYKAYDRKYLQFVDQLKDNLKEIERCEAQLDFENWYSRVGFIYYEFMKDKYKRI